jgi:hypothetical protein
MSVVRVAIVTLQLITLNVAQQVNFRGSAQMKEEDVRLALGEEFAHDTAQLAQHEENLREMFESIPKNKHGLVGHQVVRYALHRYFLHRHGWFIRGLEPGDAAYDPPLRQPDGSMPPAYVKEWVPNFLQKMIEFRNSNDGMNLHDVAVMAATLEDLIRKELTMRLKMVYRIHSFPVQVSLPRSKVEEVLTTYMMSFLLANNVTAYSNEQLLLKEKVWKKKYSGFHEVESWMKTLVDEQVDEYTTFNFTQVSFVAGEFGRKFHKFNDLECDDLRQTLKALESRKPGRVRLSTFYNMSRFTHWRFTEKPEYLQNMGALDTSDSNSESVIMANYVMARPNCLEASNLYAVCCRNLCEDLMVYLERAVGYAEAKVDRISELVSALPSPTVTAPRQLSAALLDRLQQIAKLHGGQVPLHGRLFAQWMHHAFPRECPYPHEKGTISPQTPDEWMRDSGGSIEISPHEIQKRIENDVCAIDWEGKPECGEQTEELPWSFTEELLHNERTDTNSEVVVLMGCGLSSLILALLLIQRRGGLNHTTGRLDKRLATIGLSIMSLVAYWCEVLDGSVFWFALVLCCGVYLTSSLQRKSLDKCGLPVQNTKFI